MLKIPTAVESKHHSGSSTPRSDTFQLSESIGDHF
jgi:hypothetical protein